MARAYSSHPVRRSWQSMHTRRCASTTAQAWLGQPRQGVKIEVVVRDVLRGHLPARVCACAGREATGGTAKTLGRWSGAPAQLQCWALLTLLFQQSLDRLDRRKKRIASDRFRQRLEP